MSITFGGLPVLEPYRIARQIHQSPALQALGPSWVGKVNGYRTTVGPDPGRGHLLMMFKDFDKLDWNKSYNLVFQSLDRKGKVNKVTIVDQIIIGGTCVTPGAEDAPTAAYLVETADYRWLCWNPYYGRTVNKAYNVRAPAGGQTYYADSLTGGATWTWQQMLNDLWNAMNVPEMGDPPNLPVNPDGIPEGLRFHHVSAWLSYNEVLRKLGMAYTRNPFDDSGTINRIGEDDPQFDNAEVTYKRRRHADLYPKESNRAKVPKTVKVCFHKVSQHYGTEKTTNWAAGEQWSLTPITSVDVDDPNGPRAGTQQNSIAVTWDDLPAIVDYDGAITNQAALDARAQEQAADYFRTITDGGKWIWRQYTGFIQDDGFIPGRKTTGLAYYDKGRAPFTEVLNLPGPIQPVATASTNSIHPNGLEWTPSGGMGGGRLAEIVQPPDLGRATYPVYPPHDQILIVTSTTSVAANVYPGKVLRINPTDRVQTQLEDCRIYFPSGAMPSASMIVRGRLNGAPSIAATTLPLYVVTDGGGGSSAIRSIARSTAQPIFPQNVVTKVTWTSGTAPFWAVANPTRFTVPASQPNNGIYRLTGAVRWTGNSTGSDYGGKFYLNGANAIDAYLIGGKCSGLDGLTMIVEEVMTLNPNNYVELGVFHNEPSAVRRAQLGFMEIDYIGT